MKNKELDIKEYFDPDTMSGEPIVVIKKLTFGAFNDIQDEITNISVKGQNNVSASPKVGLMKMLLVQRSLVSAPFAVNDMGTIRNLAMDLGEFLYEQVEEFNEMTPNSEVDLETP